MIEVTVRDITQETPEVRRITLASADGALLPPFEAGAHIDVHLPNGLVRQYSLVNKPGKTDTYQLGVLKDKGSRGGSLWIHENLKPNDRLRISPPRNLFPVAGLARRHILFAGGIGITPILSIAQHLSASGADFDVHYSVRNRQDAAFYSDLTGLPARRLHLHADGREVARAFLLDALSDPAHDTQLYACGPSGYIQTIQALAQQQSWPENQLRVEAFSAAPSPPDASDQAFTIRLARAGVTFVVAKDQSVIDALRAHGFDIPSSCEQGICGTCLTKVISGIPDHRDQYLTDEEQAANDQFTPCCSRALSSELVLDL